jgi:hypothetical protein
VLLNIGRKEASKKKLFKDQETEYLGMYTVLPLIFTKTNYGGWFAFLSWLPRAARPF